MRRRLTVAAWSCALATLAIWQPASAAIININNHSFESPVLNGGQLVYALGVPNDWSASGPGQFWIVHAEPGAPETWAGFPGGLADGKQFAIIMDDGALTSQSLGPLTPSYLYTLTVALGRPTNVTVGDYTLELLVGGVVVASQTITGSLIPSGTWQDYSLQYISPISNMPTGNIQVRLGHSGSSAQAGALDNVRLEAHWVPEPGTFAGLGTLLAAGTVFGIRRRK